MTHRNRGIGSRIIWMVLGISPFVFGQSWCENAWAQEELFVTNSNDPSVTVYARSANGNTAPLRTLQGNNTGLSNPGFAAVISAGQPLAAVALNKDVFGVSATLTYQATLTPGVTPTQVDIYLGCLLPDLAAFLSLVQSSPGVITTAVGPSPVPFLSNVTLIDTIVQFNHTFGGFEPQGTYFPYAGLAVAGTIPSFQRIRSAWRSDLSGSHPDR